MSIAVFVNQLSQVTVISIFVDLRSIIGPFSNYAYLICTSSISINDLSCIDYSLIRLFIIYSTFKIGKKKTFFFFLLPALLLELSTSSMNPLFLAAIFSIFKIFKISIIF